MVVGLWVWLRFILRLTILPGDVMFDWQKIGWFVKENAKRAGQAIMGLVVAFVAVGLVVLLSGKHLF